MTSNSEPSILFSGLTVSRSKYWLWRRQIATVIIGLLLVVIAIWFSKDPAPNLTTAANQPNSVKANDNSPNITPVVIAPVRRGNFDVNLLAIGTVTPLNAVEVYGRVDGQIISIENIVEKHLGVVSKFGP